MTSTITSFHSAYIKSNLIKIVNYPAA